MTRTAFRVRLEALEGERDALLAAQARLAGESSRMADEMTVLKVRSRVGGGRAVVRPIQADAPLCRPRHRRSASCWSSSISAARPTGRPR